MTHTAQGAPAPAVFTFRTTEIRTVIRDGNAWFVASDVAKALAYGLATDMTRNLDDDERGMQIVHTPSGDQEMIVINESGLYHAVLKSRKPEAKTFRKWVTAEVLPAIRNTGRYAAPARPRCANRFAPRLKVAEVERFEEAVKEIAGKSHCPPVVFGLIVQQVLRRCGVFTLYALRRDQFDEAIEIAKAADYRIQDDGYLAWVAYTGHAWGRWIAGETAKVEGLR
ncbi:BRO-N domain-containing protein [Laribacter hongkongensis]|uniref:BRO-N domain-containing protein n=1 Tax=Laribacter hongkongensis TaxID=168471 RepID=UPI001EFE33DB|nr:Bro-N domain-containing protein [Laribacter hongkongensis]MCG9076212.1 Bro-N domain-containing protein [Laribacter hongkongensis]